jgi:hypothetical protein
MLTLDDIRIVAEDYVKESLPDEFPYFGITWERIGHPLSGAPIPVTRKAVSRWRGFLPTGLAFEKTASISVLTPVVILTLEAVALEMGGTVAVPERRQLVEAIRRCARTFGASADKAGVIAGGLADRLAVLLNHKSEAAVALTGGPSPMGALPFMIWESDKNGVPIPVKGGDAAAVSRILQEKGKYDVVVHGRQVHAKQFGKQSVVIPMEGVMINLLTLLVRYKTHDLTTVELYESACRTGAGTPQAAQVGYSEKDLLTNYLRSPLSRLRREIEVSSFVIKNTRSLGYRCEGEFTFRLVFPSADEPKTRIARLG